ncbi:MAG: long-chain fatty acid--CoA ligase [Desulfobulbaceae bacterium]|nr:MAG: long-chain fatty acid--CoA ligase [Desulfobulbaceae bacterium]
MERPVYENKVETLFDAFLNSCTNHANQTAYIYQVGEEEITVSYAKLLEDVLLLSRAFQSKGVNSGDRVMFLSDNRYAWMVTDLALMSLCGVTVPRGSDTPTQELAYIIENSNCSHLVIETPELLETHREQLKKIKGIKNIFVMTGPTLHSLFSRTYSYQDLLKDRTYSEEDRQVFIKRGRTIKPDQLLTIIYTSGTTGMPKGVRLKHSNIMHNVNCIPDIIGLSSNDRWLSILPSWHIFERTAEYVAMVEGCCLVYSSVKQFAQDLEKYRPTVVATVPRVWEALYGRVQNAVKKKGKVPHTIFTTLVSISARYRRNKRVVLGRLPRFGNESAFLSMVRKIRGCLVCTALFPLYLLAQKKLAVVRQRFGGRLRLAVSGGGTLAGFIEDWIDSVGIRIVNAYGMTECSPAIAGRGLSCRTYGTLGTAVPETDLRIVSETGESVSIGEEGLIEVRGPQVTEGYENNPAENEKAFTEDGFFKTGDLGKMTINDELIITGRAKDIIVLASGENIDPSRIESTITMFPFIEDAVLVGQDKKGLGALLVPNLEEFSQWTSRTFENVKKETDELLTDNRILEQIRKEMNRLLRPKKGFKPYEKLHGITFLDKGLTHGEELTNTLKKKRHVIERKYREKINELLK